MTRSNRVMIVANYRLDNLQSMERYAQLLERVYKPVAQVRLVRPPVLVGHLLRRPAVLSKYLGYIDKFILFFVWLFVASRLDCDYVHIADHGNSLYAFACPPDKFIITCHDVLAIRSARGDSSTACHTSKYGKYLQASILSGLRFSRTIVFVSKFTLDDYMSLAPPRQDRNYLVIHNPLNAQFESKPDSGMLTRDEIALLNSTRFLLMVGSSLPRKNRELSLRLISRLSQSSGYHLVLAGSPLSESELDVVERLKLSELVTVVTSPRHSLLNSLYCNAHALLFPSFSEGFGWPLIEAQMCLCPVIASCTTSIPEVAGDGALYADPTDIDSFCKHVLALESDEKRRIMIELGVANVRRYDFQAKAYSYQRLVQGG